MLIVPTYNTGLKQDVFYASKVKGNRILLFKYFMSYLLLLLSLVYGSPWTTHIG